MHSNISVLPCGSREAPTMVTRFRCPLKKEPPHHSEVKNVLISRLSSKQCEPRETTTVALDSVDTLLRCRSMDETSSSSRDANLNDLFEFIGREDEKKTTIENSVLVSALSIVKNEEPPQVMKLPAVDQIMPSFTRTPTPPSVHRFSQVAMGDKKKDFGCLVDSLTVNTFLSPMKSSIVMDVDTPTQVRREKLVQDPPPCHWKLLSLSKIDPIPSLMEQPSSTATQQQQQPRFILPSTSKPHSVEVALPTQALLVPTTTPSLLVLPLALAATLQQQHQQQHKSPPTFHPAATTTVAISAPSNSAPALGSSAPQLVLIQTADGRKTYGTVNVVPTSSSEQSPALPPIRLAAAPTPSASLCVATVSPSTVAAAPPPSPQPLGYRPVDASRPLPPPRNPPPKLPPTVTHVAADPQLNRAKSKPTDILPAPLFAKPSDRNRVSPTIETVPPVQRRHQCPYCVKSCERKDNLQAHIRTHTGERPYPCRYCAKAFPQKDHLRAHIRTHTGEKPYKCVQCFKAFAQLGNLHRHAKTHLR